MINMLDYAVGPDQVVASNVPASPEATWAAGTTYTTGQRVQVDRRLYEALQGSTGQAPATSPDHWLDLGATNPWRAFDRLVGSRSAGSAAFEPALHSAAPGAAVYDHYHEVWVRPETDGFDAGVAYVLSLGAWWDTLVVLGLEGQALDVVVRPPDGTIQYAGRFALAGAMPESDWWHYLFSPVDRITQVVITRDMVGPVGADSRLYLSVVAPEGGTAAVGNILAGPGQWIGTAQYPAEAGYIDYSQVTEDEFGRVTIVPRDWVSRADLSLVVPEAQVPQVLRLLAARRAVPSVWIPHPGPAFAPAVVYGIARRAPVTYALYGTSYLSLSLRGMT